MNKKGFTLIELLATLAVLGIVVTITVVSVSSVFKNAKEKSEDVFVDTIKDAMDMYLDSKTDISEDITSWNECHYKISKTHGLVKVYMSEITFDSIVDSKFKPITQSDLVNPANKDVSCSNAGSINVNIYKDDDFVYYYSIDKDNFNCLKNSGLITNLPFVGDIDGDGNEDYYSCN